MFQYAPELLRPPNIEPGKREELLAEMRNLLDDLLAECLQELGYPKDLSTYKVANYFSGFDSPVSGK